MRRIFGSFDNYEMAKPYFDSMENVSDVHFYLVQYKRDGAWDPVLIKNENVTLIQLNKRYPGNVGKLNDWYELYKNFMFSEYDWCIFTDMHDVVFQDDIGEFGDDKEVYVAYEGKIFEEIGFWRAVMPVRRHKMRAYNCGVFAAKPEIFETYLLITHVAYENIKEWKKRFTAESIGTGFPFNSQYTTDMLAGNVGSIFNGVGDTYIFNSFMVDKDGIEWDDVCTYNFMVETGKAFEKDGKMFDKNGRLFPIVHYNGKIEGRNK